MGQRFIQQLHIEILDRQLQGAVQNRQLLKNTLQFPDPLRVLPVIHIDFRSSERLEARIDPKPLKNFLLQTNPLIHKTKPHRLHKKQHKTIPLRARSINLEAYP